MKVANRLDKCAANAHVFSYIETTRINKSILVMLAGHENSLGLM